jgi:hypothetical protein
MGRTVRNRLAREGVFPVAYRWWYDRLIHRDQPFAAHRRLHAQVIAFEAFPVVSHDWPFELHPGDHVGCKCVLSYLLRGPDGRFLKRAPQPVSRQLEWAR